MRRGIAIKLSERSWQLIAEALETLANDPFYRELEENHQDYARLAKHIKAKLTLCQLKRSLLS